MALAGFAIECKPNSGGVKMVHAISASELTSFTLGANKAYENVTLEAGSYFAKYQFKQDEAEIRENTVTENGSTQVTHELEMLLEGMDEKSRTAVQELADTAICGIVLIETDSNGRHWVHGYSEEMGKERPIRNLNSEGTSGRALSDQSGFVVTLTSVDTHVKREFIGTIPVAP